MSTADAPDDGGHGASATSGPSSAEISAAARVAGEHRVSLVGADPDRPQAGAVEGRLAERPAMDFWRALYERRTTRQFDAMRPVPREVVLELLDAALIAPTSCNLQMWDFVVVDDPEQREKLGRLSTQILTTPVSIYVAYGKEYSEEGHANVQSVAAAMQNMSLAAHVLGMGTFWINQLGPRDEVGRILGLPKDREVVAALAVGWPKVYPTRVPKRRSFEHVVHWNHFSGRPIPTSPRPRDWSLDLIRDYQQARVLNGNRYNKARPWELDAALTAALRVAPRVDQGRPAEDAKRWLDVLPVHGLFTGAMARHHRDHRWAVLELSEDVARFAAKRTTPVPCDTFVFDPERPEVLPSDAFAVITVLDRLEALPPDERPRLLAALHAALRPDGVLVLQHVSARSFHGIASWMHARRGGPGGVEYVLAPDPNLGPFEAMAPAEVDGLIERAGFVVRAEFREDVVPSRREVDFRTRNMPRAKGAIVRGVVAVGRVVGSLPGLSAFARTRTLLLDKRGRRPAGAGPG